MRNARQFGGAISGTGRVVERTTGRMQSSMSRLMRFMGQQLTGTVRSFFYGLRMGVVGAGVAVSAFVATSLRSFRDFDKKLRETTSLIAGAAQGGLKNSFKEAQKAYKEFYTYLLRTAPQMRRTPQDLAGGLYELVQAGLPAKAAKQLLKPAAMGATAGGSDVGTSARVMVQIMNALKMGTTKPGAGKQGQKVMDQIFQAINLGVGVDFPTMATGIGKFIGAAGTTFKGGRGKQGDNTLKQLMATYIFATQQGARTADVGVGIQDVIKTIANPSVKGKKFAKNELGLGLGSEFLKKNGFIGSLQIIIDKMKSAGYTGAKLNDAIGKLFGDVRGRRIVNYATNVNMVKQALDAMGTSTNATQRAFDEQGKSLDAAIQTFKSYWDILKIGLGSSVAPYVRRGADMITGMLNQSGVTGRGQDLAEKMEPMSARARKKFRAGLSPEDQILLGRSESFNKAGLGGKIKQLGGEALNSLQAWWHNPATQARFAAALHTVINRSFTMAGAAIRSLPSIYGFGRKIAAEIIRGAVDGLKNALSGGLGGIFGGGGGGGSILPGPSGGFQAAAGGLLGLGAIRGTRGRGPVVGGLGLGAGAMMAGVPAPLAALLGIGGALPFGRKKGAAGTPGTAGAEIMRMTATNVYVTGTNVSMPGAAGVASGGGGGIVTALNSKNLKPGYTASGKGFKGPNGRFVSRAEALGGPAVAATTAAGGGGKSSPLSVIQGMVSEKDTKDVEKRLGRIQTKFNEVKKSMAGTKAGRFAGSRGGKAGMMGAAGVGLGMSGGGDTQTMLLQGLLGGIGMAGFAAGPEIGIPLMLATGALSGYLGGRGQKDPGAGMMDALFGKAGTKGLQGGRGTNRTMGTAATSGAGVVFGQGVADIGSLITKNPAKISNPQRLQVFTKELVAAIATPWDKPDAMNAHLEKAIYWAGNSQSGVAGIQNVYDEWNDYALGQAAYFASLKDTGSTVMDGRTPAQKRIGKGLHGKGKPKQFTAQWGTGTYDPRGGMSRGAPMNAPNVGFGFGKKGKRKGIPSVWDAGLDAMSAPAIGKALQKSGSDPIIGSISFATGLSHGLDEARRTSKPKIKAFMDDMAATALAMAGGGSGGSGPSAAAPPNPGTGSRFNNASPISSRGVDGDATTSAFGPAMMNAGGAMADKVSDTIAKSVAKKQMEGPIGKAQQGLRWLYQQVGKPYIWGGGHPPGLNLAGYDCSGLASSALMAMGSKLSGTTFNMIGNTAPGAGLVQLGFNPAKNPHHMGISVMGKWFEAAHTGAPIRGPNDARSSWPYVGTPKFHSGGVYHSNTLRGEGPAILKDGEMVVRPTSDGGLQAHPVSGHGLQVNGPLIGVAHIRSDNDIHRVAGELADLLEKKKRNSGRSL